MNLQFSITNRTDSNAALPLYLTHQLCSAHEWTGVWNGPNSQRCSDTEEEPMVDASTFLFSCLEERCVKDFPPYTASFGSWKTRTCLKEGDISRQSSAWLRRPTTGADTQIQQSGV